MEVPVMSKFAYLLQHRAFSSGNGHQALPARHLHNECRTLLPHQTSNICRQHVYSAVCCAHRFHLALELPLMR